MAKKQYLIITEYDNSPVAESFRALRTNIQNFKTDEPLHTIMFTSVGPKEGKSTVLANLAVAFAWADKKVLLMDCDLRRPVQHRIFGTINQGITDLLTKGADLKRLIQNTGIENLDLLCSGPVPPNPAELLASAKVDSLLEELKQDYDCVLIDTPPVVVVTDACILASKVDGIFLVVAANTIRPEMANEAQQLLQNANGKVCGVILNRAHKRNHYSYYYYEKEEPRRKGDFFRLNGSMRDAETVNSRSR
ncbi:MAG TPA: CpsD/CapB family tyrosine-protein kinase [Bacillota bacterium]|nr:CpsD/CapB family tyrosine-protein kinase [Bacillota bacterium]